MEDRSQVFAGMARSFAEMPGRLPGPAKAVLVISGHWEAAAFTVSTAAHPPMEYDYTGFPAHTYHISYPAPGAPALAARVADLLGAGGVAHGTDVSRGFDHGVFVPLVLMYPQADVPVVMLSLQAGYDPAAHLAVGALLAPLRDEGVMILGSGLNYHNMRGFGQDSSTAAGEAFEAYLNQAVGAPAAERNAMLLNWTAAPGARLSHPREDHLLPLMVAAGAAGVDVGRRIYHEQIYKVPMASYEFG
jgi:aromatic ring-opening dioxygenase catalytic subunit (LigB family)